MTTKFTELELTYNITNDFVIMAHYPSVPSGDLKIYGSGEVGSIIVSNVATLEDANGMGKLSYRWQVDGSNIPGATDKTYIIKSPDYNKNIQLFVSYTDNYGNNVDRDSNIITVIAGKFVDDIVDITLSWQNLYFYKKLTNATMVTNNWKIDGVILLYTEDGICDKQILDTDASCSITKTVKTYIGSLPTHKNPTPTQNITSHLVNYQINFPNIPDKYTKVVFCAIEISTLPTYTAKPTDIYPKKDWVSSDLTKNVTVTGTTSPFSTIWNKFGFDFSMHTLGTDKYPKTVLRPSGSEQRLISTKVDNLERLCVFGAFERSPNGNGWFFTTQFKLKSSLNGVKPLDYLKPPSKFTDLGL
jgi:hypothetical protein